MPHYLAKLDMEERTFDLVTLRKGKQYNKKLFRGYKKIHAKNQEEAMHLFLRHHGLRYGKYKGKQR